MDDQTDHLVSRGNELLLFARQYGKSKNRWSTSDDKLKSASIRDGTGREVSKREKFRAVGLAGCRWRIPFLVDFLVDGPLLIPDMIPVRQISGVGWILKDPTARLQGKLFLTETSSRFVEPLLPPL